MLPTDKPVSPAYCRHVKNSLKVAGVCGYGCRFGRTRGTGGRGNASGCAERVTPSNLSGAGRRRARGAAHVGVLEALQQLHIPVDCIAGTSMGAIVGGLYASGFSTQELQAALERPELQASMAGKQPRSLLSYPDNQHTSSSIYYASSLVMPMASSFSPQGIIAGNDPGRILNVLALETQPNTDFNKLPIPFRAVATDIGSGAEVVLDHGNLAEAMRASMSVPGVYAPVPLDNHLLVDGGLVDNLPVDVARQMGANVVIAVNVSTPPVKPGQLEQCRRCVPPGHHFDGQPERQSVNREFDLS